jgi:ABC-type sugar transport system ATPase subunit
VAGLVLEGVSKRYGDVVGLAGVDLTVAEGELLAVVGPSGCGKTTALRAVAGLETIDAGTIRIAGRDVTRIDAGDRNVAMVFQHHALFPHLTVAENIGFGLRARRTGAAEIEAAVAEAAAIVGCADLLHRRPDQISGGERQRVALARGLVRRPDVYLLDEPLSNLDAQLRMQMRRELRRLHDEVGGTMVYVTHDQVEALTLGDRVAVLSGGELQQVDTPDAVYRRPATRFVASFIGSPAMNLLPARVSNGVIHAGPLAFPISALPAGGGVAPGGAIELGIRPEHLSIGPSGGGDATGDQHGDAVHFGGEVMSVEVAGSDAYLQVRSGDVELTVRTEAEGRPAVGERVTVAAPPARVHLFDGSTGASLR